MGTRSKLYVFIAAVLWGTMGTFVTLAQRFALESIEIVWLRVAFSGLILLLFFLFFDRKVLRIRLKDIWVFLGSGIISLAAFSFLYYTSMQYSSLAVAAVLLYTAPVFVMIMSTLFFKEKFSAQKGAALAVTMLGCVFVSGILTSGSGISRLGFFAGIGSGLGYALYSIFSKFALDRGYSSMTITLYTFIFATLGVTPFVSIPAIGEKVLSPSGILLILAMAVITGVLPYFLYTKGLEGVEPGTASIIATVEPMVAALISVIAFHEKMTPMKLAGILCILLAVVILNIRLKKEKKSAKK